MYNFVHDYVIRCIASITIYYLLYRPNAWRLSIISGL